MSNLVRALTESLDHDAEVRLTPQVQILIGPGIGVLDDGTHFDLGGYYWVSVFIDDPTRPHKRYAFCEAGCPPEGWHASIQEMIADVARELDARDPRQPYAGQWAVDSLDDATARLRGAGFDVSHDSPWRPLRSLRELSGWEVRA
jgi:hypothetical protein